MICLEKDCWKEIHCKELCRFHYNQNYYSNNKKSLLEQKKSYHKENKDSKKEYDKIYDLLSRKPPPLWWYMN